MNLLECICTVGCAGKNVPEMLLITTIKDNPRVAIELQNLLDNFLEETLILLTSCSFDDFTSELNGEYHIEIDEVLDENEFFSKEDDEDEVDYERKEEFTDSLQSLAHTEVYYLEFVDGKVVYTV